MNQMEALALTLGAEIPVAAGLAWACGLRDQGLRVVAIAAAASLLTHPVAWYLSGATTALWPFWIRATILESAVVAAETAVYARGLDLPWLPSLGISTAANAASFTVGLFAVSLL
mgnify:CR=1 FL=1